MSKLQPTEWSLAGRRDDALPLRLLLREQAGTIHLGTHEHDCCGWKELGYVRALALNMPTGPLATTARRHTLPPPRPLSPQLKLSSPRPRPQRPR